MYILDALAHVIAVYNAVRHDARTTDDGPSGNLAWNLLDQFASRPVNARMCVQLCLGGNPYFIVAFYPISAVSGQGKVRNSSLLRRTPNDKLKAVSYVRAAR